MTNVNITLNRTNDQKTDSTIHKIYVGVVLQKSAAVTEIIDDSGEGSSFCKKEKDLEITLNDDTVIKLSELIGDARETMRELYDTLLDVYFAKHVVNRLA
ncbi:hypothetical protein [Saccharicrinis sp. GN24d3]|uniref:hypothetical protein n=1 Tax=Saccharicrinis sp. GN24d3 TaxID=3458416 RepID=UPI00403637D3